MRFGQFLIMEGALPEEVVAGALRRQRRSAVPFGELAIRVGRLSQRQVRDLLRKQARQAEYSRLGRLAVADGLLREADVVELLAIQRQGRPKLGELLVSAGHLTAGARDALLDRFRLHESPNPTVAGKPQPGRVRTPTRPGVRRPAVRRSDD